MESKQATGAGLYDDLVGGCEIPGTKQTCPVKHVAEKSEQILTEPTNYNSPSEAVVLKRLLCIILAVVAVCFLISAVTLILVLTMVISARSTPMTSTDCSGDAVQNPWQKLNKDPICFGAQNDSYGSFSIPRTGRVKAMKLVHKSGSIYCNRGGRDSYWGCVNNNYYTINDLMTIITNTNRDALLPPAEDLKSFPRHMCGKKHYYTLEGAERNSSELVFHNAVNLSQCQELQIWYGQDFADCGERDNSGTTCVDVYAWYTNL